MDSLELIINHLNRISPQSADRVIEKISNYPFPTEDGKRTYLKNLSKSLRMQINLERFNKVPTKEQRLIESLDLADLADNSIVSYPLIEYSDPQSEDKKSIKHFTNVLPQTYNIRTDVVHSGIYLHKPTFKLIDINVNLNWPHGYFINLNLIPRKEQYRRLQGLLIDLIRPYLSIVEVEERFIKELLSENKKQPPAFEKEWKEWYAYMWNGKWHNIWAKKNINRSPWTHSLDQVKRMYGK